jgi:4-hydroxy-tetrahydrodipicolinate synthase
MRQLRGVIPVLITPLNKDKSVDVGALGALCDEYKALKVCGIWVLGTGGEDMCLSFDQRITVARTVTECLAGEVASIIGCSFYSPVESIAFIRQVESMNFDAFHAMPYHMKVSHRQLLAWYSLLAENSSKPLWAYTSGNWAQRMPPEFIVELKKLPNIAGVKYSSSNMVDVQGAIELADESFQVITAVLKTLYACLCLGVKAATTVEASVFYPEAQRIFELFESGRHEEAYAAQKFLNNVLLKYPSPAAKDNFLRVAELKYLLSLQGSVKEYVTDYYRMLTDDEKAPLREFFDEFLKKNRTLVS